MTTQLHSLSKSDERLLKAAERDIEFAVLSRTIYFLIVGRRLDFIRRRRLYRAISPWFAEYAEERFSLHPVRAYQMMRCARLFDALKRRFAPRHSDETAMALGLVPANEYQVMLLSTAYGRGQRENSKVPIEVWGKVQKKTKGQMPKSDLVANEMTAWRRRHQLSPRCHDRRQVMLRHLRWIIAHLPERPNPSVRMAGTKLQQALDLLGGKTNRIQKKERNR